MDKVVNVSSLFEGLIRLTNVDEVLWSKTIKDKQIERYSTTRNGVVVCVADINLDGTRVSFPASIACTQESQYSMEVPFDQHAALLKAIKAYPDRKKVTDTNTLIYAFLANDDDVDH